MAEDLEQISDVAIDGGQGTVLTLVLAVPREIWLLRIRLRRDLRRAGRPLEVVGVTHYATLDSAGQSAGIHLVPAREEGARGADLLLSVSRVGGAIRLWSLGKEENHGPKFVYESSEAGLSSMFSHSFGHYPVGKFPQQQLSV